MKTKRAATRERLLRAAIDLFQTQGYHATGVAEILAQAAAPKGSLYHHFPGGKEQLGVEAVAFIAKEITDLIARRREAGARAADIVRQTASGVAAWLARSGWRRGVLLSVLAQETAPGSPALHRALSAAFDAWRGALARAIREDGAAEGEAAALADLGVAALSGGTALARIDRNNEALLQACDRAARLIETATR